MAEVRVPRTERGTVELAIEDADGNPTGEIVPVEIVDHVANVPDEHLGHFLSGVHGSSLIGDAHG